MQESNSLGGLTDDQAREFHKVFMSSFIGFIFVAVIAHILVFVGIGNWVNPPIGM